MTAAAPRRAIVTGGAGFLGRHLCRALAADGWSVTAVDDLSTAAPAAPEELEAHGVRLVRRSVTQPHALREEMDEPVQVIYHLACPASPRDYRRLPLHTLHTCAEGTRQVLEAARGTGARVLLASTSEVYGDPPAHPQRECHHGDVDPVGPRSCYDEGKRYAEALTRAYRDTHGVDAGIARIFNTYGPGMRPDDGRMVPAFIGAALAGEPLTVEGDGRQTRSLCFVDDMVRGLRAVAAMPGMGPVNLGNPEEVTVLDVARRVCLAAGRPVSVRHAAAAPGDPVRRRPDITRARRAGWSPTVPLDAGLAATLRAWPAPAGTGEGGPPCAYSA